MTEDTHNTRLPKQQGWKTCIGWSIAGVICGHIVLGTLLVAIYLLTLYGLLQNGVARQQGFWLALIPSLVVQLGSTGIYIFWLNNKRSGGLTSIKNGVVSFWNCFFGGAIFGAYWNSRLTKDKGFNSFYFLAVLIILATVLSGYSISLSFGQIQEQNSEEEQSDETESTHVLNTHIGDKYSTGNFKINFESLTWVGDYYYITSNGKKWDKFLRHSPGYFDPHVKSEYKWSRYKKRTEHSEKNKQLLLTITITNLTGETIEEAACGYTAYAISKYASDKPLKNTCLICFYRNANNAKRLWEPECVSCLFEGYGSASDYSASLAPGETRRVYISIPYSAKDREVAKSTKYWFITCQDVANNVIFKLTFNRKKLPHKKCLVFKGLY